MVYITSLPVLSPTVDEVILILMGYDCDHPAV